MRGENDLDLRHEVALSIMRSCDNTGNRSCAYMMTVCSYFIALFLSGNIRHNQSWFKKKQHTNTIIGILVKHLDRNITTESLRVTSLAATLGHGRSSRVNLEICWFGRCGFGGDMRHVVSLNSVSEIRQKCSWGGKTGQTKHLSILIRSHKPGCLLFITGLQV